MIFSSLFWQESFPLIKNSCKERKKRLHFWFFIWFLWINLYNHVKKSAPNQADNNEIFQSCLLPKMRLSVFLEGRYIGYQFHKKIRKLVVTENSWNYMMNSFKVTPAIQIEKTDGHELLCNILILHDGVREDESPFEVRKTRFYLIWHAQSTKVLRGIIMHYQWFVFIPNTFFHLGTHL